jgi:hypothetical protein
VQELQPKKRSIKSVIEGIPFFGKFARLVYSRLRRLAMKVFSISGPIKPPSNPATHLPADVHVLDPTTIFGGSAHISNPEIATRLEALIRHVATELSIIVFPTFAGNRMHIGFLLEDLDRFTEMMTEAVGVPLRWGAVSTSSGLKISASRARRQHRMNLTLDWDRKISTPIAITLYNRTEDGIVSRDSRNVFLRRAQLSTQPIFEIPGIHLLEDFLGGRSVEADTGPVDVVYTWVNHDDKDWQALYSSYKGVPKDHQEDAQGLARFVNRDELRYSLRSVERYIPWVNHIYVFTNCAPPDWFVPSERISWVRHEAVMAKEHLPSFNSHAIESYLHHIPGLKDNFIYFNDDFFINAPVPRAFFHSPNGLCNANLEDYGVVNGDVRLEDKDYLNAARNGAALLKAAFGVAPTRLHKHTPYALNKTILHKLEAEFAEAFARTRQSNFRQSTDISVASFLFHHYAYAIGRGTRVSYNYALVKNTSADITSALAALRSRGRYWTFCLNDGGDSFDDEQWNTAVSEFMATRFKLPTMYEVPQAAEGDESDGQAEEPVEDEMDDEDTTRDWSKGPEDADGGQAKILYCRPLSNHS